MKGPFEAELKIRLTNGETEAVITYQLPAGQYATEESTKKGLDEAVAKVIETTKDDSWRLMNRNEFENAVIHDRSGGMITERFATKETWD